MTSFILAIDQGTTSTRAIVFDDAYRVVGVGQQEFPQHFPKSGWVEHDAEDLWATTLETMRLALAHAGLAAGDIAAIGITNQRETTVVWDRETGRAIHKAIVWQDRRTAEVCTRLKADGAEPLFARKTGLLLDPYFSGTKVSWILDAVPGARADAEAGKLAFGTVDSFLLWRLTGGKVHATDAANAPRALLPDVRDSAADFGVTDPALFGAAIPIRGIAGDQQAATVGQACFEPGMMKSTYGTGCFALLNTGTDFVPSTNRLLTTVAYRLDGKTTYALEGSIFVAGAAVQWLRDGLKVIDRADATWWHADARGALFGLTRNTGPAELARAALESVCYQTADLLSAMKKDWRGASETVLRVDGGMVASDWTLQRLADLLDAPVDRPVVMETTALGAAWLAGRQAGVWPDQAGFAASWKLNRRFTPAMPAELRLTKLRGWADAVRRTLTTG